MLRGLRLAPTSSIVSVSWSPFPITLNSSNYGTHLRLATGIAKSARRVLIRINDAFPTASQAQLASILTRYFTAVLVPSLCDDGAMKHLAKLLLLVVTALSISACTHSTEQKCQSASSPPEPEDESGYVSPCQPPCKNQLLTEDDIKRFEERERKLGLTPNLSNP